MHALTNIYLSIWQCSGVNLAFGDLVPLRVKMDDKSYH